MKKIFFCLIFLVGLSISFNVSASSNSTNAGNGEYLIGFSDYKKGKETLNLLSVKEIEHYKNSKVSFVKLTKKSIETLKKDPNVVMLKENKKLNINLVNNLSAYNQEINDFWHLEITSAFKSHGAGFKGDGVRIAVIDTGIEFHQDFIRRGSSAVVERVNCTTEDSVCVQDLNNTMPDPHGTGVASTIISQYNGIAPESDVISVRVLSDNNGFDMNSFAKAYEWCIDNNIDIITTSTVFYDVTTEQFDFLQPFISSAFNSGIVIFAASGNPPINESKNKVSYPASASLVVGVGGVEIEEGKIVRWINEEKNQSSAYGPQVEIVAPAPVSISVGNQNNRISEDGTSLSSPLVAGAFALLKQQFPSTSSYNEVFPHDTVSNKQELNLRLLQLLKENAIPMNGYVGVPEGYGDWEYGAGLVQAIPYGIKGTLDLTSSTYVAYTRPDKDSPAGKIIGSGTFNYYQEWNGWYKVDYGNGSKVWIKLSEPEGNGTKGTLLRVDNSRLTTYYNTVTNKTFTDHFYWRQTNIYTPLNFSDIDVIFDYHPSEGTFKMLRSMQSGGFYDSDSSENLTLRRSLAAYFGNFLASDGSHPFKGTTDYRRFDLMNQYNLVLRDAMGQTYFVPVWSHSRLSIDVEAQTIKPMSTDFVHVDGYNSYSSTLYGLKPTSTSRQLIDKNLYFNSDSRIGTATKDNYQTYNYLTDIEKFLGNTKLTLISY